MRRFTTALACLVAVVLAGCGGGYDPASGQQILDDLEAAELIECVDTRSPVPDVITCVDDDGDVTVGLTDDASERAASLNGDGPFIIGQSWIVLTYDGDDERVMAMRDSLGGLLQFLSVGRSSRGVRAAGL